MKIASFLACACLGAASVAAAQKFVVAAPAGSGADVVARAIAAKMGATVENGPPEIVAKAAPDGSTLLFATPTLTAAIALQPNLPFDGLKAFAPVARVANEPLVLVATANVRHVVAVRLHRARQGEPGTDLVRVRGPREVRRISHSSSSSRQARSRSRTWPRSRSTRPSPRSIAGNAKVAFAPYGVVAAPLQAGKLKALAVTAPCACRSCPKCRRCASRDCSTTNSTRGWACWRRRPRRRRRSIA